MTSSARASLKSPTSARRYSLRRPLTPVPARRRRPRKVSVSSIGATAGAAGPGSCWGTLCCRGGCLRAIWRRMSSVMPAMPNEWRRRMAREISPSRMSSSTRADRRARSSSDSPWRRPSRPVSRCQPRARSRAQLCSSSSRRPSRHSRNRVASAFADRPEPRVPRCRPRRRTSCKTRYHLSPRSSAIWSCAS